MAARGAGPVTPRGGDLDHRCCSWDPGVLAGPIADAAGASWRCCGFAMRISAPGSTELPGRTELRAGEAEGLDG